MSLSASPPASTTNIYTHEAAAARAAFAGQDLGELSGAPDNQLLSGTFNKAAITGDVTTWAGLTFDQDLAGTTLHLTNGGGHAVSTTGFTEFMTGDLADIDAAELLLDIWTPDGGSTLFAKATRRET